MTAPPEATLWNPAVELLPREELRALQFRRLKKQLAYNFKNSAFYRGKIRSAGFEPGDIGSFDDFAKIPLMSKDDHRTLTQQSLERHGNPYALMGCAKPEDFVRINATSGTTGMPTLYTLTQHDVDVVNEMHARKYWRAGIRSGDVMLQALSLSMFTGGLPLSQGIQHMGACVVPVGIDGGSRRVLQFIDLTRPKALIATPSFGRHLIEECGNLIGKPASELGIERFFCAGEPGGGDPEIRSILAEGFAGKVFDHTGGGHAFHGISCDCAASDYHGMHFTSEDHCLLELIDPEDRSPVELADGAIGEMVWTFLDWQGAPFMRYAIGDVAQIWTTPCSCGMPGIRFRIIGRADDMLIVKGVNIYPRAVGAVLARFFPRVTGAFRIVLDRPGPLVDPPLVVRLERGEALQEEDASALEPEILAAFRSDLRITPKLIWLPARSLPREAMKTKLIEIETRSEIS